MIDLPTIAKRCTPVPKVPVIMALLEFAARLQLAGLPQDQAALDAWLELHGRRVADHDEAADQWAKAAEATRDGTNKWLVLASVDHRPIPPHYAGLFRSMPRARLAMACELLHERYRDEQTGLIQLWPNTAARVTGHYEISGEPNHGSGKLAIQGLISAGVLHTDEETPAHHYRFVYRHAQAPIDDAPF